MVVPETVQKYALFGGLRTEQIELTLKYMKEEWLEAGEDIIKEGAPNDSIRFILEGRVAVTKRGSLLAELGEGESFGEMEVLDIMPSAADIHTLARTHVLSMTNRNLHHIYKDDILTFSMLIMNLARDLSRRLRKTNELAAGHTKPQSPVNDWG
jgi:CRP-like cAMP-binding protein